MTSSMSQNTKQRHREKHQYQRIMRSRGVGEDCWGTKRRLRLQTSPCKKHIHLCIYTARVVSPIYVPCWPKTSAPSQKALSTDRAESEDVEKAHSFKNKNGLVKYIANQHPYEPLQFQRAFSMAPK